MSQNTRAPLAGPAGAKQLELSTQDFVDSLRGGAPIYTLSPDAARGVLSSAQKSIKVGLADVAIEDRVLDAGPTGRTNIRVVRPMAAKGALPVVVYMHGGGWVLGDKETHDRLVRELAVGAGAVIIFVDYERSPESRYPAAIEQGYAVAKHVSEQAHDFGGDANRLAIAGDSVGGNMAAVIALMAKERNGPKFAAQLLFYPVTDASMSTASYAEFAEGPWLTKRGMAWFWDQYLPDHSKRSEVHASPLNASTEELRGLPRTLLIVDENDVLRDEGEAYGRKLAQAGVPVTSLRYNGTIHDFMMLNALAATPAVRAAVAQANGYLRNVFAANRPGKSATLRSVARGRRSRRIAMHVEQILDQARQRLVIVDVLATIRDGAGMMSKQGADMLVVCDSGVMVGVITKTDIVVQAGRNPESILGSAVADIMTRDVAFCQASDLVRDVLLTMRERGVQRVPAVDAEHRPIGVIYGGDALLCLLNEAESEDKALREYISGVGYQ